MKLTKSEEKSYKKVVRLYRKQKKTMEEIAAELEISLRSVSRIIYVSGAGEERYQNESIPSKGSISIMNTTSNSTGRRQIP